MTGQTLILATDAQRKLAHQLVDKAPAQAVFNIREATRTLDQNARMWAMLSDISRQKPLGRRHTPETWKQIACHACGWSVQFEQGVDGQPFPVGFKTSAMTKAQMSQLIEWLLWFGAENDVRWSDPSYA